MYGAVQIEFAVTFDALRCPRTVIRPLDVVKAENLAVVGPVHHVLRGVASPVKHRIEIINQLILVMRRVKVQRVAVHHRSGIGRVNRSDNRVFTLTFCHFDTLSSFFILIQSRYAGIASLFRCPEEHLLTSGRFLLP